MYNEKIKKEYIKYKKSVTSLPSERYLDIIFEECETREEDLNKDINSFSTQEILELYKEWNLTNLDTLLNKNAALTQYVDFCIEQNVIDDYQNHFRELNAQLLRKCINNVRNRKRMISKEQLLKLCSSGNIENASEKFIILALFEGIKGVNYSEITNASKDDFDKENLIYHACTGNDYHISKTLYNYAEEAWNENIYYTISGKVYEYEPSDKCIKTRKGFKDTEESRRRYIRRRIDRVFSALDMEDIMTANAIYESGMIDYAKKLIEESGLSVKEYIFGENFTKDMKKQNYIVRSKKKFYTKYSMYLE